VCAKLCFITQVHTPTDVVVGKPDDQVGNLSHVSHGENLGEVQSS
jgi:hypothetical protein